MEQSCRSVAHPSLAVVKYWGKAPGGINVPAVPSVAVTLAELESECTAKTVGGRGTADCVWVNGSVEPPERFAPLLDEVRRIAGTDAHFELTSNNSFPTAAGLASSSSGMAAVAAAAFGAALGAGNVPARDVLSRVARLGSGSAARAVFGGFTRWDAGAEAARQLHDEAWWPELRVVVVPVARGKKPISSREAMERTRSTSPYYDAWVSDGPGLADTAQAAIEARDIEKLGATARLSYLRMFATMFSADPPVMYWLPASVDAQQRLDLLRRGGTAAWETMDAGPQVKVMTLESHVPAVLDALADLADGQAIVCSPGPGVTVRNVDR